MYGFRLITGCVVLFGIVGACRGQKSPTPESEAMEAGDQVTVEGRVVVVGSTPFEQVIVESEAGRAPLEIEGEYRQDLRNLSGARVKLSGEITEAGTLVVEQYEILRIGGRRPEVGILDVVGEAIVLHVDAERSIPLQGVPAELRDQRGAKVWVIVDDRGAVKGYGIIREP